MEARRDVTAECWKPTGFPDYEASDRGRVRSFKKIRREPVPHVLVGATTPRGYKQVQLMIDGKSRMMQVHRLVLLAFVGPCPDGMEVRHLDGNPGNNTLGNIKYGTPSENGYDRVRHGNHRAANQVECIHGHPFDEENTYYTPVGRRACRTCQRLRCRGEKSGSSTESNSIRWWGGFSCDHLYEHCTNRTRYEVTLRESGEWFNTGVGIDPMGTDICGMCRYLWTRVHQQSSVA